MFRVTDGPGRDRPARTRRARLVRLVTVSLLGLLLAIGSYAAVRIATTPHRTTPVYEPPVLAGQTVPGYCSAGFYARRGDTIVLTSSEHCAGEGTVVRDPVGGGLLGVIGPTDRSPSCPYPDHTCAASDMNYLIVEPARIPWGHLNVIDMGVGGYRTIAQGTEPLSCADIAIGDPVEIDSQANYRSGVVTDKGDNLKDPKDDGSYFPCMIGATVRVGPGDSGGSVLVRGLPAGVVSRSFGGYLGFTPLAEGLAEMGLTLCDTPDCGL
ncbi:MAG: hypothetical protein ABI555_00635, partial [Chloroflexota bacterium]